MDSFMNRKLFFIFLCLVSAYIIIGLSRYSYAAAHAKWEANYNKSVSLFKDKKYNSALKTAQEALKENKNPLTYELIANILQFKKQYKLSIDYYKKSIISVLKSKNFKNGDKFLSSAKNSIALNYLLIGNNLLKKRKIDSAINFYKKGIGYASQKRLLNFLMLNLAMGYENTNQNHFKKALYYSNKVLKNNPANSYAYFIKGRAEYGLEELNLSLKDLKTAYKLDPKNKMIKNAIYVVKKDIAHKKHNGTKNIKQSSENLFK
ncbi:MAG: tetratricopeptide repeat protein [bacterium]